MDKDSVLLNRYADFMQERGILELQTPDGFRLVRAHTPPVAAVTPPLTAEERIIEAMQPDPREEADRCICGHSRSVLHMNGRCLQCACTAGVS